MTAPVKAPRTGEEGFTLIPVLWMLGLLAEALLAVTLLTTHSSASMVVERDRLMVEASTMAAIEQTALRVLRQPKSMPPRGRFNLSQNDAEISVDWTGEGGRLDLNVAPARLLFALCQQLEIPEAAAKAMVTAIVARRQPVGTDIVLAPNATMAQRLPFHHLRELSTIGADPAHVRRLAPFVTVYGGSGFVDPRLAAKPVLASLPGMTPLRLEALMELKTRDQTTPLDWLNLAENAGAFLQFSMQDIIRIAVSVRTNRRQLRRTEVVIDLFPDDVEPYRILDWDETADSTVTPK